MTISGNWRRWTTKVSMALLVSAVTVMAMLMGCDPDRTEATRSYNEAMHELEHDGTGEAITLLEESLEADPTFYHAAYMLAQIQHQRLRSPEDAVENYRRALDQEPDNIRFQHRVGWALTDSGEYEEAIEYLEDATSKKPEDAHMWFNKGRAKEGKGAFLEAIDAYSKSIEHQPRLRLDVDDPGGEHYYSLGDLYYRFRLYDEAVQVFENGVKNNPDSKRLYHGLGLASAELERYDDAIEAYEAVLEMDPTHEHANFNLADAYYESGNIDDAIDQLKALTEGAGGALSETHRVSAERRLDELTEERDQ